MIPVYSCLIYRFSDRIVWICAILISFKARNWPLHIIPVCQNNSERIFRDPFIFSASVILFLFGKRKLTHYLARRSNCDLHVGRIPDSVTQDELQRIFPRAISIEYRRGKTTRDRFKLGFEIKRSGTDHNRSNWFVCDRFAFLHFKDVQSATYVIEHANQYHIGNQPLSISYQLLK